MGRPTIYPTQKAACLAMAEAVGCMWAIASPLMRLEERSVLFHPEP